MTNYYRLHDKNPVDVPSRWYLKGPIGVDGKEIDARRFNSGRRLDIVGPVRILIRQAGPLMDFTLADFDMPVVRRSVADTLQVVAGQDIQRFPATVDGMPGGYDIINILPSIPCLDETRSEVTRWPYDPKMPDRAGKYLTVSNIRIRPELVDGHRIFRIAGWRPAIIVSADVKEAIKGATGTVLEPV